MTASHSRDARHRRRTIGATLHRVHRWMGVVVSLFVVFLVLTGWALNHAGALDLGRISVRTPWIAAWYGLRGEVPATGHAASGRWLIGNEEGLLLDGKRIDAKLGAPIGMVSAQRQFYIASRDQLLILDSDGRVIETLNSADLPGRPITRIGLAQEKIVLQAGGEFATSDGVSWSPYQGEVTWATSQPLPADQLKAAQILAPSLSLERIVQDLHSGRVFGRYGPLLMDAVGLIFLLLAASGLWMFFRHRRR